MNESDWFSDIPVIGKMTPETAVAKLRELGDDDAATALEQARTAPAKAVGAKSFWPFQDKPWQHTAHTFGFIAEGKAGHASVPIRHAVEITPDKSLQNSPIRITLSALRVANYPGGGSHRILFDFYGQNQVAGDVEHLHFNTTYRVREGERAAVLGYPIFVGLRVGSGGVAFKCFTVNVSNDEDEKFLSFLESDAFRRGLKLASTLQPAVSLFSETALGLTKAIARRNRNVPVQEFYLGLDLTNSPMAARLAEGSYIAVQIPESFEKIWDWREWVYQPSVGNIVNQADPSKLIPYNYIAFNVTRYQE